VKPATAIAALAEFQGVRRRLELRGTARGIAVYDDFAHHPTAIRATLEGLRARAGTKRILAVLEPRSNTMKLGVMKDRLAASLEGADRTYVYAGELGWNAAAVLQPLGARARCFEQIDSLVAAVAADARTGDQVLVMSNGGFGGVHGKLLAALGAPAAA
jgi:UDP-N-acetylmuramate: L-alanyl-gamma-D-glutamyl-meso-diaminopimelate ligase